VAKKKKTALPKKWRDEVREAVSKDRLKLGDPKLEAEIRDAFAKGRVRLRTQLVEKRPKGDVHITDM
jgi:hypothetical protein